jgi:flagellar biosynthetic protein FlhB
MALDQTERPTRKRLEDARKRGQVARSRDLAVAAASVATTFAVAQLGGRLMRGLQVQLAEGLGRMGDAPTRDLTGVELAGHVASGAGLIAWLVGPVALVAMVSAVGMHGFQGGWTFAPGALQWNWSRLSPASGVKRLGLTTSSVDALKAMVGVAALVYLAWGVVEAVTRDSVGLTRLDPIEGAVIGWGHVEVMLWRAGIALGLLALGDYGLQYYRFMQSMRMSRQEVRDEARQQDGSAEMKGRVRRVQRDMSRRRMIGDVAKATVVITNPTHYAVALEYRREAMAAPRVLAKGRDLVAQRIREAARKHEVPVVENKPLAQALYKTVEVGETIPSHLFAAVAEVLAYLVRLKRLML